jgi:hypothetical protein
MFENEIRDVLENNFFLSLDPPFSFNLLLNGGSLRERRIVYGHLLKEKLLLSLTGSTG